MVYVFSDCHKNWPTCAVAQHSMDNVVACVGVIIVWCGSCIIAKYIRKAN